MQPSPTNSSMPNTMPNPMPNAVPGHMPTQMPMMPMMPNEMLLARAYIPDQPYDRLFPLDEALMKGTLFPNLYQPYNKKCK